MPDVTILLDAPEALARHEELAFLEVAPWRERDEADPYPGSIPLARAANVRSEFAGAAREDTGHLPLPDTRRLRALARELRGDRPDRTLVVYARRPEQFSSATRAWFALAHAGIANVAVLDGGLPAWLRAGGALSARPAEPMTQSSVRRARTDAPADAGGARVRVLRADEVAEVARHGTLLDARSADAYHGTVGLPRTGHVPGAVHAPARELIGPDGLLLPPAALRRWLLSRRAIGNQLVAAYCGGGVASSSLVFAGALLGQPIGLYVDSWSHWQKSPDRPVEHGLARTRPASEELDCLDDLTG